MKLKRSKDEYLFIRQEILQYLNNYQSVRDMMYASTLTCLGLGIFFDSKTVMGVQYLFLLPLVVIIPSFLVAVNFWKSVVVDSSYLRVFYEEDDPPKGKDEMLDINTSEDKDLNFRWETRHAKLFKQNHALDDKVNVQHIPYVVCALCCIGLFWWELLSSGISTNADSSGSVVMNSSIDNISVIIGIVVTLVCLVIFKLKWNLDTQSIMDGWKQIKEQEESENTANVTKT